MSLLHVFCAWITLKIVKCLLQMLLLTRINNYVHVFTVHFQWFTSLNDSMCCITYKIITCCSSWFDLQCINKLLLIYTKNSLHDTKKLYLICDNNCRIKAWFFKNILKLNNEKMKAGQLTYDNYIRLHQKPAFNMAYTKHT